MKVLGLDIATQTGWSVLDSAGLIEYGIIKIPTSKKAGLQARLLAFKQEMISLYEKIQPEVICFEAVYSGPNVKTTQFLNMLRGIAVATMPETSSMITVVASSARLKVIGKGNCGKKGAFDWVKRKYLLNSFKFSTHNDITDSIVLAEYGKLGR